MTNHADYTFSFFDWWFTSYSTIFHIYNSSQHYNRTKVGIGWRKSTTIRKLLQGLPRQTVEKPGWAGLVTSSWMIGMRLPVATCSPVERVYLWLIPQSHFCLKFKFWNLIFQLLFPRRNQNFVHLTSIPSRQQCPYFNIVYKNLSTLKQFSVLDLSQKWLCDAPDRLNVSTCELVVLWFNLLTS